MKIIWFDLRVGRVREEVLLQIETYRWLRVKDNAVYDKIDDIKSETKSETYYWRTGIFQTYTDRFVQSDKDTKSQKGEVKVWDWLTECKK